MAVFFVCFDSSLDRLHTHPCLCLFLLTFFSHKLSWMNTLWACFTVFSCCLQFQVTESQLYCKINLKINFSAVINDDSCTKNDQHLPSPTKAIPWPNIQVMRIKQKITKNVLMFKQILPTCTMINVQRTVRRTHVLILGLRGLNNHTTSMIR